MSDATESGKRPSQEELYRIALYQKGLLLCVLLFILAFIGRHVAIANPRSPFVSEVLMPVYRFLGPSFFGFGIEHAVIQLIGASTTKTGLKVADTAMNASKQPATRYGTYTSGQATVNVAVIVRSVPISLGSPPTANALADTAPNGVNISTCLRCGTHSSQAQLANSFASTPCR